MLVYVSKQDNKIIVSSTDSFDCDRKNVRNRLVIVSVFSQFVDCVVPVFKNNDRAKEIILNDIKHFHNFKLEEIQELPNDYEFDKYMCESDFLFNDVVTSVPNDILKTFFELSFHESGINDEQWFISEQLRFLNGFTETKEEIPVLRQYIFYLENRLKTINSSISNNDNQKQNTPFINNKLTPKEKRELFVFLTDERNGYIDKSQHENDFLIFLGENVPNWKFNQILWLKNKQLLRELLQHIKTDDKKTTFSTIEENTPKWFRNTKGSISLAKNKTINDTDSDKIKDFFGNLRPSN